MRDDDPEAFSAAGDKAGFSRDDVVDVDDDYTSRNVDLRSAATSRALMSEDDVSGGQYAAVDTDDDGGGLNLDAVIYSELLVSRQYVHAYKTQEKNENTGRIKEVVHRDKRAWRCNVHHTVQISAGVHLKWAGQGGDAQLRTLKSEAAIAFPTTTSVRRVDNGDPRREVLNPTPSTLIPQL